MVEEEDGMNSVQWKMSTIPIPSFRDKNQNICYILRILQFFDLLQKNQILAGSASCKGLMNAILGLGRLEQRFLFCHVITRYPF